MALEATKTLAVGITTISSTLTTPGFSTTKIAHGNSSLAALLSSLVGDICSLDDYKLGEMSTQLASYFKGNGIYNEEILSIMTNYSIWPRATKSLMITIPVTICLSKIATYTEFVLDNSLLFRKGMQYSELVRWYDAGKLEKLEKKNIGNSMNLNSTGSEDHKVPAFEVQTVTAIL